MGQWVRIERKRLRLGQWVRIVREWFRVGQRLGIERQRLWFGQWLHGAGGRTRRLQRTPKRHDIVHGG